MASTDPLGLRESDPVTEVEMRKCGVPPTSRGFTSAWPGQRPLLRTVPRSTAKTDPKQNALVRSSLPYDDRKSYNDVEVAAEPPRGWVGDALLRPACTDPSIP